MGNYQQVGVSFFDDLIKDGDKVKPLAPIVVKKLTNDNSASLIKNNKFGIFVVATIAVGVCVYLGANYLRENYFRTNDSKKD